MTTDVSFGITEDGRNVLYVGEDDDEVADLAALVAAAPDLDPEALARAVNHLAVGSEFSVIGDVNAYALSVRSRLESEPAGVPWQEGVIRLRDHGLPDIRSVEAPARTGNALVFFAADRLIGAPYRVEVDLAGALPGEADYQALPLRPLASTAAPQEDPDWEGDDSPLLPPEPEPRIRDV